MSDSEYIQYTEVVRCKNRQQAMIKKDLLVANGISSVHIEKSDAEMQSWGTPIGLEDMGHSFILSVPDGEYEHAEAILTSVVEEGRNKPTIILLDWDHNVLYHHDGLPIESIEPAASSGSFYFFDSSSTGDETFQFFLSKRQNSRIRLGPSSYWHSLPFVLDDDENPLFREAYCESLLRGFDPPKRVFQTVNFGNAPRTAKNLGYLVRSGRKTATAGLSWSYQHYEESYPVKDEVYIVLNGKGIPLAAVQNTDVSIVPFNEVSAAHAEAEGEGDRSLTYWRSVHWRFFTRECKQIGCKPNPTMPVVCETFQLLTVF